MAKPDTLKERIRQKAQKLLPQQIRWRRHLHQYPELSNEEFKTTEYIRANVKNAGLKEITIKQETGLLAELNGTNGGRTVAIRTDIDALPVTETTGLSYQSKINGRMHACGHDMHMAVVLGVANLLAELKSEFHGNVRFVFQPAEEMPPGGARPMIAGGALKDVSMILAMHVDPHLATGKISLLDGVAMASVTDFDLTIHGRGGHAARPNNAVDAIAVAADVVNALQKIVSRQIDPISPVVITIGKISGGTARNTICDRVNLVGTARALTPSVARKVAGLIRKTAGGVCRAHGASLEMNIIADYPPLSNHPRANKLLRANFEGLFGKGKIEDTEQVLGGEDFACYLEKTTGAMFRLGIMNKKIKADKGWHSPLFIADEQAIFYGTALLASTAIDYLRS